MKRDILKYACINSFLTASYIGLVVSFLFYVPRTYFPQEPDTALVPMMMLMLFVFSAAVTSTLMLGRPILWYLDGKKKEAVNLFLSTLAAFFCILLLAFIIFIATQG